MPIAELRFHSPDDKPSIVKEGWSNPTPRPPAKVNGVSLIYRERYNLNKHQLVWFLATIQEGMLRGLPTRKYVATPADFAEFGFALREWKRWAQGQLDEHERQPANATSAEPGTSADTAASETERAKGPAEQRGTLPVDLQDYVSATAIVSQHSPPGIVLSHKRLKLFLDRHPSIRTARPPKKDGTPRMNRLLIHLADWHKNREALVEWDSADRDPIDKTTDAEIAERLEAVNRQKKLRK